MKLEKFHLLDQRQSEVIWKRGSTFQGCTEIRVCKWKDVWALATGVGWRPKIERGAAFCCHRTCMQTKGAFFSQSDRQALSFLDRSLIYRLRWSIASCTSHACLHGPTLSDRRSAPVHPNLLGSWTDVQIWLICVSNMHAVSITSYNSCRWGCQG